MTMARGSRGDNVQDLQSQLKALGLYDGVLDGSYGPGTQKAVLDFQRRYFVDGIVDDATFHAIVTAVQAWGERQTVLVAPSGLKEIEARYGKIEYKEGADGRVIITNDWADTYIVEADLPVVGKYKVNREIVGSLTTVLNLIKERGLDGLIKQFWCWTPRHKMWKPDRSLSTHSWGIAVDINWSTCGVGQVGDMDPGIVAVFEGLGWEYGGRWRTSDPMHFQFCQQF